VSHEDIIMIMKSWTSSMWLLKPKNNFYSCLRPQFPFIARCLVQSRLGTARCLPDRNKSAR
jgi:hypothetical protein